MIYEDKRELQKLRNKVRLYEILHPDFDRKKEQCHLCPYKSESCPLSVPRYEGYCIEWVNYV